MRTWATDLFTHPLNFTHLTWHSSAKKFENKKLHCPLAHTGSTSQPKRTEGSLSSRKQLRYVWDSTRDTSHLVRKKATQFHWERILIQVFICQYPSTLCGAVTMQTPSKKYQARKREIPIEKANIVLTVATRYGSSTQEQTWEKYCHHFMLQHN